MGVVSTACPIEVSLREEGPFSALMLRFFFLHLFCAPNLYMHVVFTKRDQCSCNASLFPETPERSSQEFIYNFTT